MNEEEMTPRVLLVGFLISAGKCVVTALSLAGTVCFPLPEVQQESEPQPPEPSLTLTERLTWRGLQWHIARQKRRIGAEVAAQPELSEPPSPLPPTAGGSA